MELIDIINSILKFLFNNIMIYIIAKKVSGIKNINTKIITLYCFFISILYSISTKYLSSIIILPLLYFIYALFIAYISKNPLNYITVIVIISLVMSYTMYIVSSIISGFIVKTMFYYINYNNPINIIIIFLIEYLLTYLIFSIKRLKNGFYFLKNKNKIGNLGILSTLFGGFIMIIHGLLDYNRDTTFNTYLFNGVILIAISFTIWIQNEITKRYKENMKNRTIELQKLEIDEQINNINELKDNNLKLSTVIHKYNNRLSALEKAVIKALNENYNSEFSSELTKSLESIKTMSKEFSKEVMNATNKKKKLPKTNIQSIDNIFEYMAEEATKDNINFDLKINNSINYLIENIVDVKDFETLIGDHIRDAIIAINSEKTEHKSIMCILGIINNCYEFSIYDTGIEFEIETLLNLGTKYITTHLETGGTGIGFMTSFETLNKCKGSLIIEEYSKETNIYTKCITFRFDSKDEYNIYSYRSEQIKSKMKDKDRIKIKQI